MRASALATTALGLALLLSAGCASTAPHQATDTSPDQVLFDAPQDDPMQLAHAPVRLGVEAAPKVKRGPRVTAQVLDPARLKRVPKLRERRITLDVHRAPLRDVLALIARQGGVNIVVDDDVRGELTLSVRGTRLSDVLVMALESGDLAFEQRDTIIRVMPRARMVEQLDREAARLASR